MNTLRNVPLVRACDLIVQHFDSELVIYNRSHQTAICLNQTASSVFLEIDGKNTVSDIASSLISKTGTPFTEDIVWLAVNQFNEHRLLDSTNFKDISPSYSHQIQLNSFISRRQTIKQLAGGSVGIVLPVVFSIVAPTAAQAATCVPRGSTASSPASCCSGAFSMGMTCA